jgi:hypothetical protein
MPRVRLPIYGEEKADRRRRNLLDDPRFIEWFVASKDHWGHRDDKTYLLIELDNHTCLVDLSALDCWDYLSQSYWESEEWIGYFDLLDELAWGFHEWFFQNGIPAHECKVLRGMPSAIAQHPPRSGVYFVRAADRVKIGKAKNVAARIRELQTSSPYRLELLAIAPGDRREEAAFHRRFKQFRVQGEWFSIVPEIVQAIRSIRAAR